MNKLFTLLIPLFLGGGGGIFIAHSQQPNSVNVIHKDGTTTPTKISDVSKIEIHPNSIKVVKKNGDNKSHAFSDIDKIELGEFAGVGNAQLSGISIFPTIATTEINVRNAEAEAEISIFDTKSKLLSTGNCNADGNATIDVANLPVGTYLLRINNLTTKFIKK